MVDPYSTAGLAHESDGGTGILKGLWLNRGVEGEWRWSSVFLNVERVSAVQLGGTDIVQLYAPMT
jgi:hypothetical protein